MLAISNPIADWPEKPEVTLLEISVPVSKVLTESEAVLEFCAMGGDEFDILNVDSELLAITGGSTAAAAVKHDSKSSSSSLKSGISVFGFFDANVLLDVFQSACQLSLLSFSSDVLIGADDGADVLVVTCV